MLRDPPRRVNEDIALEDEFRCTKCDKVTNNQISLINHINQKHITTADAWTGNKCVTCNKECQSIEILVKHIEDEHTQQRTITNSHTCAICNMEVNGDQTRVNHICRKPEHNCSFCKQKFYSQEARKSHICPSYQFKTMEQQALAVKRKNTPCTWGDTCYRASKGRCWFQHSILPNTISQQGQGISSIPPQGQGVGQHGAGRQGAGGVEVQGSSQQGPMIQESGWRVAGRQGHRANHHEAGRQGERQRQGEKSTLWCRFQDKCFKKTSCKFQHIDQGFWQTNPAPNHQ